MFEFDLADLFIYQIPLVLIAYGVLNLIVYVLHNVINKENSSLSSYAGKLVLPVFVSLYFWLLSVPSIIPVYVGMLGILIIPIIFMVLVYGVLISLLLRKNYKDKLNSIFGHAGEYLLYILYLMIFMVGVFFVFDGTYSSYQSGSVATFVLGFSLDQSKAIGMLLLIVTPCLMALNLVSIIVYYAKVSLKVKQ